MSETFGIHIGTKKNHSFGDFCYFLLPQLPRTQKACFLQLFFQLLVISPFKCILISLETLEKQKRCTLKALKKKIVPKQRRFGVVMMNEWIMLIHNLINYSSMNFLIS